MKNAVNGACVRKNTAPVSLASNSLNCKSNISAASRLSKLKSSRTGSIRLSLNTLVGLAIPSFPNLNSTFCFL